MYIRALTGIFISKSNPMGITEKEALILARMRDLFQEHRTEQLNQEIRKKLRMEFNLKTQSLHNMIAILRKKKLITQDNKLHKILRPDANIKIIQK
jgi:hypothetical protein